MQQKHFEKKPKMGYLKTTIVREVLVEKLKEKTMKLSME